MKIVFTFIRMICKLKRTIFYWLAILLCSSFAFGAPSQLYSFSTTTVYSNSTCGQHLQPLGNMSYSNCLHQCINMGGDCYGAVFEAPNLWFSGPESETDLYNCSYLPAQSGICPADGTGGGSAPYYMLHCYGQSSVKGGMCGGCSVDSDCSNNQVCVNAACVTPAPAAPPPPSYLKGTPKCTNSTPIWDSNNGNCRACHTDSECPSGQICENGSCIDPHCTSNEQCSNPTTPICEAGRCRACSSNSECGSVNKCVSGSCEAKKLMLCPSPE